MQSALAFSLCLLGTISCAHPNRVSSRALQGLTKNGEAFVLVFGSLTTAKETLDRPEIRFVHQALPAAPEYLLKSLIITNGDRFYAVLKAPGALPFLDQFTAEVGSKEHDFDKITFVRLPESKTPTAMYIGEMTMNRTANRMAQGQGVSVTVRDDYQNAEQELKRLYPQFNGTIAKVALLRNPVPKPAAPERIH